MKFSDRFYLILAGIFISSLITANLIFQKFFTWSPFGIYTFELSVGILPYPITFLCTDLISEFYGKKKADQVVFAGLISSVFVMGVVLLANSMKSTIWSPVNDGLFNQVFGLFGPAVFASMLAYLIAQFIDIRMFHFWKRLTKGKHLWLRNNGSTIVSQLVDTSSVLLLLCFSNIIDWEKFWPLLMNGFLFKMLVALFDTPFFYLGVWLLKNKIHEYPVELD
ncbi:MAG: queuosine precursor transporter [Candidatus Marinimicrobia bacterium]|nr:queuosine precursor transporter [Candidatus Neomarinimicrobiota bacterium]MBT3936497.1 queuosine precursor transporter [Candidatus Neomarinimicrobiota bacterium]MBT3962462.1 queuosine precursor transporter [Candidatus Neomarinimicrobiota bacterium]MBT4383887.1 queuosine precursor transporter [Candidatus Neomarinimicrobiota bacterium]MBT4636394.1 queuosine precursor transporter [Candidatus Neomarinimicrobiota bacterium]